mgnify:CR=1 FL=1
MPAAIWILLWNPLGVTMLLARGVIPLRSMWRLLPRGVYLFSTLSRFKSRLPPPPPRLSFGTALSGPCHALTYFSTLPGFPRFRHSDREAQNLLIMTAGRAFQGLTHQLLQKALKVDREPVQAWMARICALNKVTRSHPLMPSCLHPFRPLVHEYMGHSLHDEAPD